MPAKISEHVAKNTLDPELWNRLQNHGYLLAKKEKRSIFDGPAPEPKKGPPTAKELKDRVPETLSVRVAKYQTSRLILRIQKEPNDVWTVGYRRSQTDKKMPVKRFLIKELTWSDKLMINALAKAWIGLRELGIREAA